MFSKVLLLRTGTPPSLATIVLAEMLDLRLSKTLKEKWSNLEAQLSTQRLSRKTAVALRVTFAQHVGFVASMFFIPTCKNFAKEKASEEAESDAAKAKNSSDLLKARQANMKYEVDDLQASLLGKLLNTLNICYICYNYLP